MSPVLIQRLSIMKEDKMYYRYTQETEAEIQMSLGQRQRQIFAEKEPDSSRKLDIDPSGVFECEPVE